MEYFKNNSWIIIRKKMILFIILDFVLFVSFFSINFDQLINIKAFCISIFWIIISYLSGRYHKLTYGDNNYIRYLYNSTKALIILFFTFKLSSLFLFKIKNELYIIFYCFISSNILFLTRKLINYSTKTKNSWRFIGSKDTLEKIKDYDDVAERNYEIILLKEEELKLNNELQSKYKNIIYEFNYHKNFDLKQIKKRELNSLSLIDWHDIYLNRFPPFLVDKGFISSSNEYLKSTSYIIFKRVLDIFLSFSILLISSPIILVICLLVLIEDGHNPFYTQLRNGLKGKEIKIVKIRSMKKNAENNGAVWSTKEDTRITNIGKIIRKTRIDELPQLISVIKGDMSLIGPRPERPEIDKLLSKEIKHYDLRYLIKPGLSGWAQVNYPYGASVKDAEYKLSYDLYYQYRQNILLDILIIIKTVKLVLNQEGAVSKN
tara:strand:- start:44454 stop:45749 length:1296 start_codon:yes stop_codon:yes gene_type:complete